MRLLQESLELSRTIGSALTVLVAIELSLKAGLGIVDPKQGIDENISAAIDEVRE